MRRFTRPVRLLLLATLAIAAVLPVTQPAYAGPAEPDVPGEIAVPAGHKLFLVAHAVGVQIYSCNATGTGFTWGLVAPRADLFDQNGKLVATHFGGPTWKWKDGSQVVAQRDTGVTVDPTAIAWLRLSAVSTSAGEDGDRFAGTSFIQRIATTGGLAPRGADCNAGTAGTIREVPYTADYAFWKALGD
jgi:uncharacterized protein DUF3455